VSTDVNCSDLRQFGPDRNCLLNEGQPLFA
jgi:hypothetical protein